MGSLRVGNLIVVIVALDSPLFFGEPRTSFLPRPISLRNYFAGEAEASSGRGDNEQQGSNDADFENSDDERTYGSLGTHSNPEPDGGPDPLGETGGVDDASGGDETRSAFSQLAPSPLTLALFGLLVVGWALPRFVDIYTSPVAYAVSLPSYLTTMIFYDEGLLCLERLVYAVNDFVPIDGSLLWEVGNVVTYYLVALLVTALYRWGRRAVA